MNWLLIQLHKIFNKKGNDKIMIREAKETKPYYGETVTFQAEKAMDDVKVYRLKM